MLAKSPDDRPQSPSEVAEGLREFCRDSDLTNIVKRAEFSRQPQKVAEPKPTLDVRADRGTRIPLSLGIGLLLLGMAVGFMLGIVITIKHPDGTKTQSKGQAHVGGYSQWNFLNVEPDKPLIIAKRIDYAYSGLVTGIYADDQHVGDWKIEGQDRKCRWRNWLFKIPGNFITRDEVTIKQVSVDAEREVNMFKLWCYQAIEA